MDMTKIEAPAPAAPVETKSAVDPAVQKKYRMP
jgi:hyperosmotically inducible protein